MWKIRNFVLADEKGKYGMGEEKCGR